ncbi:MAG: propanediol utilization protein [Natronohydrobacter sp.]|nr:propanediol utilization protein [Natronohydrobacter sp.]
MRVRVAGHFGEWVQGRLGPSGPVVLVTLPCPMLALQGIALPGPVRVQGMTARAARGFLHRLGLSLPGRVRLRACVAPGLGCGMSTARLVALAQLAGWDGPPEILARACVGVEGASDPLMFAAPEQVLWASRLGLSLGDLPALPRYELVGGFFGGPVRTDPQDDTFPDIADLIAAWRAARGLAGFAALASESAGRTLALRGPVDDPTATLARDLGALGHVIAHTGAARGLIFAPGTVPEQARAALHAAGLRGVMQVRGGGA